MGDYDKAMAELRRVLKPGGVVLCTEPFTVTKESIAEFADAIRLVPGAKDFIADAEKIGLEVEPLSGAEIEKDMADINAAPQEAIVGMVTLIAALLAMPAGPQDQLACARLHTAVECPAVAVPLWRQLRLARRLEDSLGGEDVVPQIGRAHV